MMFHVTDIGYEGDTELKMNTSVTDKQKTSYDGVADWEGLLGETQEIDNNVTNEFFLI